MSPSCLIEVYTTKANRISDALKYDMWQVITRCPPISSSWLCGLLLRCWETDKCWLTLNIGSSWGIKIASQILRHLITLQNNTWCIVIRRLTSCMHAKTCKLFSDTIDPIPSATVWPAIQNRDSSEVYRRSQHRCSPTVLVPIHGISPVVNGAVLNGLQMLPPD